MLPTLILLVLLLGHIILAYGSIGRCWPWDYFTSNFMATDSFDAIHRPVSVALVYWRSAMVSEGFQSVVRGQQSKRSGHMDEQLSG